MRGKKETTGQYDQRKVRDASFDDSNPVAALIEDCTPSLTAAAVGDSSDESVHAWPSPTARQGVTITVPVMKE